MTETCEDALQKAVRKWCGGSCYWPECGCRPDDPMSIFIAGEAFALKSLAAKARGDVAARGAALPARRVIAAALDAWLHDDGLEETEADQIIAALAAEGLVIVPRQLSAAMAQAMDGAPCGSQDPEASPVVFWLPSWAAAIQAAEAEAKGCE